MAYDVAIIRRGTISCKTKSTQAYKPHKKAGVADLLDKAAGSKGPKFREMLETEAKQLTEIGNTFQIRHSETTQERPDDAAHVDYLFHRLFSLVYLTLRASGGLG